MQESKHWLPFDWDLGVWVFVMRYDNFVMGYWGLSRENIKDVTCQSDSQFDRQFDRQFDGQLAWALRTGITLARWLANPMHLCYANLDYALLYIDI